MQRLRKPGEDVGVVGDQAEELRAAVIVSDDVRIGQLPVPEQHGLSGEGDVVTAGLARAAVAEHVPEVDREVMTQGGRDRLPER